MIPVRPYILGLTFFALTPACGGRFADGNTVDGGTPALDASQTPETESGCGPCYEDDHASPIVCNDLSSLASWVTPEEIAADPPDLPPTAWGFAPGVYAMTNATVYTGPSGPGGPLDPEQITLSIASETTFGFSWDTLRIVQGGPTASEHADANVGDVAPGYLHIHTTCPATSDGEARYLLPGNSNTLFLLRTIDAQGHTIDRMFSRP